MKTTLNPFENAKRTAQGTGGGVSPAVIEEMQAEISILGSQNKTQAQDITDIKGSLNSINDNLSGFKFYPIGTQLVAYIEGHGWYNADGKYVVWGTATANALVEASPNTYYGRQSEEDCRGEVGADTAIPFKSDSFPYMPIADDDIVVHNVGFSPVIQQGASIYGFFTSSSYTASSGKNKIFNSTDLRSKGYSKIKATIRGARWNSLNSKQATKVYIALLNSDLTVLDEVIGNDDEWSLNGTEVSINIPSSNKDFYIVAGTCRTNMQGNQMPTAQILNIQPIE